MQTPPTQHQASDEFAQAPRGVRRFASVVRRRLSRLMRRPIRPTRRCIQEAFDFCKMQLADSDSYGELARDVAELFSQPEFVTAHGQRSVQHAERSHEHNTLLELANMAVEAFRSDSNDIGRRAWANGALAHLRSCQQTSGAIGNLETTLAFLRAAYWQAKIAFSVDAWEFPAEIANDDGRAKTVCDWCRTLPPRARLLDAGCGKGRYVKLIQRERSDLQIVGVDVAEQALRQLPENVEGRKGHLLNLPAATAEFDAVLCVEALEHALLPRQATAELCRVLCAGGNLLVIDKDRKHQARSQTQPWEVWFSAEDLAALLSPACQQVECKQLRHQPTSRKSLFLAAQAIRRVGD